MTTAITYDGVESAEGGNIFEGVKFWVAQRVPIRNELLSKIKSNGGFVVLDEKQADMKIADYARKDAPAGSYSWKFVTESVENGIIQLKDRYLIGRDPDLPRPAGGGGVARSTRAPFTAAEDALLTKWVLSHFADRTGNKIFMEFEQKYPRHTWQSWRNRWVKTLQVKSKEEKDRLIAMAPDEEEMPAAEGANSQPNSKTVSNAQPRASLEATTRPVVHKQTSKAVPKAKTPTSVKVVTSQRRKPTATTADMTQPPAVVSEVPNTDYSSREQEEEANSPNSSVSGEKIEADRLRKAFYDDLEEFIDTIGVEMDTEPEIGGRKIDLWQMAYLLQGTPVDEIDWLEVADDLHPDWPIEHSHLEELMQYGEVLLEFLDATASFDQDEDPQPEESRLEVEEDEVELGEPVERHSGSPPRYVRSSPPVGFVQRGNKRLRDQRPLTSSGPETKRMRFTRDIEIPSTPDERNRTARRILRQDNIGDSEASQQLPTLPGAHKEAVVEESIPLDSNVEQHHAQPRLVTEEESALDIMPSQQLEVESLNPSPIPFAFDKRHLEKETPTKSPGRRQAPRSVRAVSLTDNQSVSSSSSTAIVKKAPRRSLPSSFTSSLARRHQPLRPIPGATPMQKPQSSTRDSNNPSQSNRKEIEECIEYYESLGYSHNTVVEGLKRTTMHPGGLASLVMESIKSGQGVPSNYEGIWTDRDDQDLHLVDSVGVDLENTPSDAQEAPSHKKAKRALERLNKKHRPQRVQLRREFLRASLQDEGGDSNSSITS